MKRLLFLVIGITLTILARSRTLNPALTGLGWRFTVKLNLQYRIANGQNGTETSSQNFIITQVFPANYNE